MRLGFLELVVILGIILLVIGPKQIPKLTSAISSSAKKFKDEFKDEKASGDVENAEAVSEK